MEMLIVMSLMTFIFSILFSMIMSGVRIWERLKCGVQEEHNIYSAMDAMRKGLHAFHPFAFIPFKGAYDRMDFPVLMEGEEPSGEREPGRVSYYYDRSRKTLCRSQQPYRGMRRSGQTQCRTMAENIEKVRISYLRFNPQSRGFSWMGYWSDPQPPVSIKMELEYYGSCTDKKSKKEFLVSIPVGPIG